MQITAFISGKGGVGKTTLTANIAIALAQHGKKVLVIDLDPQNALGIHLGMDQDEYAGHSRDGLNEGSMFRSPFGVTFVPFGLLPEHELRLFETELRTHPYWLRQALSQLPEDSFDFVLLDTPPGPGVFLHQALMAAHDALVVILADAASFSTVPAILSLIKEYTKERKHFRAANLLLNQLPHRGQLGQQVRDTLMENYGTMMLPIAVHRDSMVAESLAYERPVLQYDPGCEASLEMHHIAEWLINRCSP